MDRKRLHRKPAEERQPDPWLCGYACALANVNRRFDRPTLIESTLQSDGITLAQLEAAGVEDYDLDELRKCVRQPVRLVSIHRPRRRHSNSSKLHCELCAPARCAKAR